MKTTASAANLETRNHNLFAVLVRVSGHSDTVEGEMLRAINRITYRFSNDGDVFFGGYGVNTVGPAHTYLVTLSPLKAKLDTLFKKATEVSDKVYRTALDEALGLILAYIENKNGKYTPNVIDLYTCAPLFTDDGDNN